MFFIYLCGVVGADRIGSVCLSVLLSLIHSEEVGREDLAFSPSRSGGVVYYVRCGERGTRGGRRNNGLSMYIKTIQISKT